MAVRRLTMRLVKSHIGKRPDNIEKKLDQLISRGHNQIEMAAILGVSRPTVQKWLKECGYVAVTTWIKQDAV